MPKAKNLMQKKKLLMIFWHKISLPFFWGHSVRVFFFAWNEIKLTKLPETAKTPYNCITGCFNFLLYGGGGLSNLLLELGGVGCSEIYHGKIPDFISPPYTLLVNNPLQSSQFIRISTIEKSYGQTLIYSNLKKGQKQGGQIVWQLGQLFGRFWQFIEKH